jgi:hypothetical protein
MLSSRDETLEFEMFGECESISHSTLASNSIPTHGHRNDGRRTIIEALVVGSTERSILLVPLRQHQMIPEICNPLAYNRTHSLRSFCQFVLHLGNHAW